MTLFELFLYAWFVLLAFGGSMFVYGCVKGWGLEMAMPIGLLVYGSAALWVVYLIVDKAAQHISIH